MGKITLEQLIGIIDDGNTPYISICPYTEGGFSESYCEEYGLGIDELVREPWYQDVKGRAVKRIYPLGGGECDKLELWIELE